jgi:hypothetical protein
MQALIRGHQCLSCGEVTDDNANLVTPQVEGPNLSNSGVPIKELSDLEPVGLAPVFPDAPVEALEEAEEEEPESVMGPPFDLSSLSPEQLDELRKELDG